MTDPQPSDPPDIADALPGMLPDLRRSTLTGWAGIAAVAVTAFAALVFIAGLEANKDGNEWEAVIIVLGIAVALCLWIAHRTRRAHEARIMPIMAQALGLGYQQDASYFLSTLPVRLLPKAGKRSAEDMISGKIGDRAIRFAEVKLETGGKNSSTLFQGIVAEFPNLAPMPPFFLADEGKTRTWLGFAGPIKVDDLIRIDSVPGSEGRVYGVWASRTEVRDHPALAAVLKILTHLEYTIGSLSSLYTASSNGEVMHVALTHKRNLFKIGGLFAATDALMDDIRMGYRDLTIPLTIASKLLEAEKAALTEPAAAVSPPA
jgi:hypothetical protein